MATFSLTPGLGFTGVLDYSVADARKFEYYTTKSLEPENLFDVIPKELHHFLKVLTHRAVDMGWTNEVEGMNWEGQGILQIPDNIEDQESAWKNLLEDYRQISLEKINEYS